MARKTVISKVLDVEAQDGIIEFPQNRALYADQFTDEAPQSDEDREGFKAKSMKDSPLGDIQKVDVGIALAHFDMTLEEEDVKGTYSFSDPGIPTPENTHYIVTYRRI